MSQKKLRCKAGLFRNLLIDGGGKITWDGTEDYVPITRITGKNKLYQQVQLIRHNKISWFYVHRLMAFSWHGESPHILRYIVDHSDGDSLNNSVENLRWVTPTANQINKACRGIVEEGGFFFPKVAGFVHRRYKCKDEELCISLRAVLVECYVRYNCRFPNIGNDFPHISIHKY